MPKFSKEAKLVRSDAEMRDLIQALQIRFTWMTIAWGDNDADVVANEFFRIVNDKARGLINYNLNIKSMNSGDN